jgi:hypothetical protein
MKSLVLKREISFIESNYDSYIRKNLANENYISPLQLNIRAIRPDKRNYNRN